MNCPQNLPGRILRKAMRKESGLNMQRFDIHVSRVASLHIPWCFPRSHHAPALGSIISTGHRGTQIVSSDKSRAPKYTEWMRPGTMMGLWRFTCHKTLFERHTLGGETRSKMATQQFSIRPYPRDRWPTRAFVLHQPPTCLLWDEGQVWLKMMSDRSTKALGSSIDWRW